MDSPMWKNVVAPTILVIAFWGLSSVATAYYIRSLEAVPQQMIRDDLTTIQAAAQMRYHLGVVFRAIASADRPISRTTAAEINQAEAAFQEHFAEAVRSANSPAEKEMDAQIEKGFDEFTREVD